MATFRLVRSRVVQPLMLSSRSAKSFCEQLGGLCFLLEDALAGDGGNVRLLQVNGNRETFLKTGQFDLLGIECGDDLVELLL